MRTQAEINNLLEFIQGLSVEALRATTGLSGIAATRVAGLSPSYERMVFIAVSSWALGISFRVFYSPFDSKKFIKSSASSFGEADRHFISDFMKEYTNIVAGQIMRRLESELNPMGLSIPLENKVPVGFNSSRERADFSCWRIQAGPAEISCQAAVEIKDKSILAALNHLDSVSLVEDSEPEFL